MPTDGYISLHQAARMLNSTNMNAIRRMALKGRIRSKRIRRELLVAKADIIALLHNHNPRSLNDDNQPR